MYYEVFGFVNGEKHNLGFCDDKKDAIEWAWFCLYNRGYDSCGVVDEDGAIVAHYNG